MSNTAVATPAEAAAVTRIPLKGLRGAVARSMAQGWTVPRVAMTAEVDVTRIEAHRAALQGELGSAVKLTLNAYVLRAVALTLAEFPRLNAYLKEDIELQPEINLGFAVAVAEGLMVPVIKGADGKSIADIACEARELAEGARSGKLSPGAYQRGTFTVTNLGMTGIDSFTPIISAPQVAILGITRVQTKPVVRDGFVACAPMMGLHLVFDHRAVDGYPAALFLTALKQRLEAAASL